MNYFFRYISLILQQPKRIKKFVISEISNIWICEKKISILMKFYRFVDRVKIKVAYFGNRGKSNLGDRTIFQSFSWGVIVNYTSYFNRCSGFLAFARIQIRTEYTHQTSTLARNICEVLLDFEETSQVCRAAKNKR